LGEHGQQKLLGIPPGGVAPEGGVGTARDGPGPFGIIVLVPGPADRHFMITVPDTIADGLRHTSPAPLPWEVNKVLIEDVVTVGDDDIIRAMRWAFEYLKIVVEPSGAVTLAALAVSGLPAGPAGVVISGGSVDFGTFRALMAGLPDVKDRAVA
jgi:threonine dehydratase